MIHSVKTWHHILEGWHLQGHMNIEQGSQPEGDTKMLNILTKRGSKGTLDWGSGVEACKRNFWFCPKLLLFFSPFVSFLLIRIPILWIILKQFLNSWSEVFSPWYQTLWRASLWLFPPPSLGRLSSGSSGYRRWSGQPSAWERSMIFPDHPGNFRIDIPSPWSKLSSGLPQGSRKWHQKSSCPSRPKHMDAFEQGVLFTWFSGFSDFSPD